MAEAVVSFAIERLGDLLISEAKFLLGVGGEIEEIRQEMKRMQCFLEEADKKQSVDKRVQNWVAEMRDLAFKTEDVIETFALDIASKKNKSGIKEKLKRFACILREGTSLHKVGKEIETIKSSLSSLTLSLPTYGITKGLEEGETSTSLNLKHHPIIYFHDVDKDFIGMKKEIEQIISHLMKKDNGCEVVSLCGMGGLGKTTVAKQIYNHSQVRAHFEAFGSVSISQQFDSIKIFKSILEQLLPEGRKSEVSSMGDQIVVEQLYKVQQEKTCLILIDDIWMMEDWKKLCPAFPIGVAESGSKILLTTRSERVAQVGSVYKLRHLTEEEGWQLLYKKAFPWTTGEPPVKGELSEMESIGKEMVVRCKGLPLAVSTIGGMLRGKTLREWKTINRDIPFHLAKGEGVDEYNTVTHVLGLSYDDLPPRLRQCFLCLCNYKEDEEIKVEQLYLCWLGEGLLLPDDKAGGMMLEVAERYLNELAQRSLVEVEPWEYEGMSWSKFEKCRVHDLIRELCISRVKEEKVIRVIDLQCKPYHYMEAINNTVRRLCLHAYGHMDESDIDRNVTPQVRSLFLFNHKYDLSANIFILEKLKLLRVLTFQGFKLSMENLRSTTKLVFLKYLSFKGSELEELPSSIENLRNLETLDLRVNMFRKIRIPNVLRRLKQLKHLYLPSWSCFVNNQEKVRLDGLEQLQLIEGFCNEYFEKDDLIGLSKLKVFEGIIDLDEEKPMTIKDTVDFVKSKELFHSSFEITGITEASSLILLLECPFIDILNINRRITLPKEYNKNLSSGRLSTLSLYQTELDEDSVILLEKLPNLRSLLFNTNSYIGREMVFSAEGFPQLQTLEFNQLPYLTYWLVNEGAMPNLSMLHIMECPELQMLPDGLRFLTSLKQLSIDGMHLASRIEVRDGVEGPDFYKIRHIPIVDKW